MSLTITYPAQLPVSARRQEVMAAIKDHQVVIIAGETGSGKTTQIPKMCLELGLAGTNTEGKPQGIIGHTQPRRLAARTVAERIAEELGVSLGEEVGYQVRFTDQHSPKSQLKVMTDGVLLAEIQRDRLLRRYSVLIIDEAHERSLNIDFLLGYLKQILPQRPDLKLIITSATIDPGSFAEHFHTGTGEPAPILEISGRTYPVEIRYRPLAAPEADEPPEDAREEERDPLDAVCDAALELAAEPDGDILVFFSGEREIRDAADALRTRFKSASTPRSLQSAQILPLFARLSLAEQHAVFSPGAQRRIILATNVAETSLTVPGIKYVIDTGTARISRYSSRTKVQRLPIERISRASAAQRAGRCGRTSDGICIRLYSEEDFNSRPEFTDPEILRTNLAAVILDMIAMGVASSPEEVAEFPFIQPPATRAIADGVTLLREIGALRTVKAPTKQTRGKAQASGKNQLTGIGRKLAQLPVDPRMGRMIVESSRRGCLKEVLVLAAALSIQDPRQWPSEDQPTARQSAVEHHKRFSDKNSDFTGYLNLWRYLQEQQKELSGTAFRKMCHREYLNYLRVREWQDLYSQLKQLAKPLGMQPASGPVDPVGKHDAVHQSLLSGLLTQIGMYQERRREYLGPRGVHFAIFPGSALFKRSPEFVMSAQLVETSRLWARVNAAIDPAWVEAVTGDLLKRDYSEPHWSSKRGAVMGYEKVTLFGLPIVAQRRVGYAHIDPALSRELFIRHALVEGRWRTHHEFFHRNRKLLAELEEHHIKTRTTDGQLAETMLLEFYQKHIGTDVVSARHFDSWWKQEKRKNPQLLDFQLQLEADPTQRDTADFPATITVSGSPLELEYHFDPGAAASHGSDPALAETTADGVTVTIPALLLPHISPIPFSWLVPGMLTELVTAWIRALPKPIRKHFVPAPETAKQAVLAMAGGFDPAQESLPEALGLVLRRLRGYPIPEEAWDASQLPPHLRMRFRVVDAQGQELGLGRDLLALQTTFAAASRRALAQSLGATPRPGASTASASDSAPPRATQPQSPAPPPFHERQGITSWDMDNIDHVMETQFAGQTLTAYPALLDERDSVKLTVFPTVEEAQKHHRLGVARLLFLNLPSVTGYLKDHLSPSEKLSLSSSPRQSADSFLEDTVLVAITQLLGPELPYTQAAYEQAYQQIRAEVIDHSFGLINQLNEILRTGTQLAEQISGIHSPVLRSAQEDLQEQLDKLLEPGFLLTSTEQLSELPRYLNAMQYRITRLAENFQKDTRDMETIHRITREYHNTVASLQATAAGVPATLQKVPWMIEELRVSFFAQHLGTAYPISEKRIHRALQQAMKN